MADRLFQGLPRNEAQIIQAALRSGDFLKDAPSTRAMLMRRMERMEDNARLRAVQERRRGMEAARRTQDDSSACSRTCCTSASPRCARWGTRRTRGGASHKPSLMSKQAVPAAWTARQDQIGRAHV